MLDSICFGWLVAGLLAILLPHCFGLLFFMSSFFSDAPLVVVPLLQKLQAIVMLSIYLLFFLEQCNTTENSRPKENNAVDLIVD